MNFYVLSLVIWSVTTGLTNRIAYYDNCISPHPDYLLFRELMVRLNHILIFLCFLDSAVLSHSYHITRSKSFAVFILYAGAGFYLLLLSAIAGEGQANLEPH